MLQTKLYINASCVLGANVVYKNERKIFSTSGSDLKTFLLAAYHYTKSDYPKFYKMDNLSKLGFIASEILIKDEELISNYLPEETGIVLCNKNASFDTDVKYFETVKNMASPALFVYTLPNIMMGEIAIRNEFKGENACFISDRFNAVFIEQYVSCLFDNKTIKLCICGWVDVLDENYKATLFLVSKNKSRNALLFSMEDMNRIFKSI